MTQVRSAGRLAVMAVACGLMLAACGGGGGGGGGSEGRAQAISFTYPGGATLLSGSYTLKATASSGLPVAFRSGTPATCTVSGDQLTPVAKGECLVYASQPGGDSGGVQWASADETSQLFVVLGHAQSIVPPVGVVLRASSVTVSLPATTEAGLAATYVSTTPAVCTVSSTQLTALSKGTCQLAVTAPADANYTALSTTKTLSVDALPPVIVATGGKTQKVALDVVDSAGKALSYTSSTPAVCKVEGNELQVLAKGLCSGSITPAGGAAESFSVFVDPRFFASLYDSTNKLTAEGGEIGFGAGVPLAGWCGGVSPSWCNQEVTMVTSTFGFDIKPAALADWKGSTADWWSYYNYSIGAPRKKLSDNSYELQRFDVPTEETMFVTLAQNQTLFAGGGDLFVRIRTNHLGNKNGDGSDCYVTASAHLHPTSAAQSFVIQLKDFAVTNKCGLADLPQTEGWMFDWGVTAESKAAALAEIRAHGIRALEFAPGSINLSRPTPKADGSLPATTDADYTLSTDITVIGPITVQ